ncbi:regulatory protein, Fis family [Desulfurobacterium pacificum]|jgi:DNA-binding NtrC family response regulator|uniref:Regulatory protein, Fis family n=1 Tax=Desulfurobacterium pacificum TaxID=240166 RepID=A0ABY1NBV3_9BACT|nr:response regulator [Desulfurobacterium pacificum]SMP05785.1 regulatory protein, Fis family [Desulfurobacterium pacificum]
MKVLIVDDEKGIRETIKEILQDEGYEVFTEEIGSNVERKIEEVNPDIIILDLFLPGMSGMDVLEKIHATGEIKRRAVIIVSGHGTVETSVKALKLGAFDFLEKPIKYDKLMEAIENAVEFVKSSHSPEIETFTSLPLKKAKEEFEKAYIIDVLKKCNGDLKEAAKFMGIDISNLYRKLNKYNINPQK